MRRHCRSERLRMLKAWKPAGGPFRKAPLTAKPKEKLNLVLKPFSWGNAHTRRNQAKSGSFPLIGWRTFHRALCAQKFG